MSSALKGKLNVCLVVLLVLVMVFCLTACSDSGAKDSAAPDASAAKPAYISLAGGQTGGTYNILASGMAQVGNKYMSGVTVNAETTTGSTENMKSLTRGDLDFGFATVDSAYYARLGTRDFTEKGEIEMIMSGYEMWTHIFVRKDSKITSIEQLKGKNIGSNPGVMAQFYIPQILEAYGFKTGDYKQTFLSHAELADAMRDKQIDAIIQMAGVPTSSYTDLSTTTELVALPIDSEHLAKIQKIAPYFSGAVLKAGSYKGVDQDVTGVSVIVGVFAKKSVSKDVVYQFTKAIFEHTDELKVIHPLGSTFTAQNLAAFAKSGMVPIHEGALQYLTEKGLK